MNTDKESLIECLVDFLNESSRDIRPMISIIEDNITSVFPIDESKLLSAVRELDESKNSGKNMNYLESKKFFDVTKTLGAENESSGKIYLKGFIAKNCHYLHFFKSGENFPFLKIKSSTAENNTKILITSSNSAKLLRNEKLLSEMGESFYLLNDEFYMDSNTLFEDKVVNVRTSEANSKNNYGLSFSELENYQNFYMFLKKMIFDKYGNIEISDESALVLFRYFYDVVQSNLVYQDEFSFNDLIKIIDSVVNDKYNASFDGEICSVCSNDISTALCQVVPNKDGMQVVKDIEVTDGNNVSFVRISRSEKYANIELFDKQDSVVCRYLICSTLDGFTMFRSICDDDFKKQNPLASFTFNVSENELKITSISDKSGKFPKISPIEIFARINPDGSICYKSESKAVCFVETNMPCEQVDENLINNLS
jgi:hypothetical protein